MRQNHKIPQDIKAYIQNVHDPWYSELLRTGAMNSKKLLVSELFSNTSRFLNCRRRQFKLKRTSFI